MDLTNDLHMDPQAISVLEGSLASAEEVDPSQKHKKARKKRARKKKKQILLGDSSLKTDTAIKDPSHESLALPDSLSSQGIEECNERRKRKKTEHNAVESNANGCGSPENIFPSKTSTPALDMPSDDPIQCVSTKSVTRQPCMEADNCQGGNEEKEQQMLKKAAESSNGECEVKDVSCYCNSAIANKEVSAKESVLESVNMNIEHSINDHNLNPEEKSGFVKNASVTKKQDDYPAVCDSSDKVQNVKTYTRRKTFNFNCNKEPAMQDHRKDDPHKFSDGPFTVGLMEGETKFSGDQVTSHGGPAAEEMKLDTENTSGKRLMTTSSVVDIPVMQLEETNARQLDHAEITRNDLCCPGDVSDLSLVTVNGGNSKISQFSLDRTIISYSKNKLLILDVNGLLADFVTDVPGRYKPEPEPDLWLKRRKVYKRPFCDDFLQFCLDRFHVGVWSSRAKRNVDEVVKFLMGESASKLLFCWIFACHHEPLNNTGLFILLLAWLLLWRTMPLIDRSHCTATEFSTVENREKPLVLKELWKLWEKVEPSLPWEKGEFNESNTLLLDDSPYKALMNPMHTAIFPYSYQYTDTNDSSLGPGGDLRVYLEGLAKAENVQEYVSLNPFGQRPIRETNPSWRFYRRVIESVKRRQQHTRHSLPERGQTAYRTKQ